MQVITNEFWCYLSDSERQSLVIKADVDDSEWEQNAIDMPFWHLPYPLKVLIRERMAQHDGTTIDSLIKTVKEVE